MERVVKRFLLHNNRDTEDIRESDFDELKQDVQAVRFDLLNDLRQVKSDTMKFVQMVHAGMSVLGEYLFKDNADEESDGTFKEFQSFKEYFDESNAGRRMAIRASIMDKNREKVAKGKQSEEKQDKEENSKIVPKLSTASADSLHITQSDKENILENLSQPKVVYMDLNEITLEE